MIATKKALKTIDDENFCRNVCRLLSEDESLSVFVLDLNGRICGHGAIAHWSVGDVRMFPVIEFKPPEAIEILVLQSR